MKISEKTQEMLRKILKTKTFSALILVGIFLIGISAVWPKKKSAKETPVSDFSAQEYTSGLQTQIAAMVTGLTGDSHPTVVVTLESGMQYAYAKETEQNRSEKNKEGDSNSSDESKTKFITVKTSDGGEQALKVTEYLPQIRGVAVVCSRGDDEAVAQKIREAVTAALHITSQRVYVGGSRQNAETTR